MMDLTFQEAARGVNKDIRVNVKDTCGKCMGKKAEPGTKIVVSGNTCNFFLLMVYFSGFTRPQIYFT
jgi:DnaJ-class molecular chaperone